VQILEVHLSTSRLAAQHAFWADTLGLGALDDGPERFTVAAGATRLTFEEVTGGSAAAEIGLSSAHVALDVPADDLDAARAWLAARVPLVTDDDGAEVFDHPPDWASSAVYFLDPDGNVAELVGRRRRRLPSRGAFGPASLVGVSEVGIATPSVPELVGRLHAELGIGVWLGADERFATVGAEDGLFVVVAEGRSWWPTAQPAGQHALEVAIAGTQPAQLQAGRAVLRSVVQSSGSP